MGKATLKRSEVDLVMRSVANVVRMYVTAACEPLVERIARIEARKPEKGDKGEPGRDGNDGKDGSAGDPGRDGSNGTDGVQGPPGAAGKDGNPGAPGRDGVPGRDGRDGAAGLAGKDGVNGNAGRDGIDGKDGAHGKDGTGWDDLIVEFDGERTFKFITVKGEQRKDHGAFVVPLMIYRGVFNDGEFAKGDVVTWAGALWHCNEATSEKPGDGSNAWTLAVKKGRDGKDGVMKPPPPSGPLKL